MKKTVLIICGLFTFLTLCPANIWAMEDEPVDTAELIQKIKNLGSDIGKKCLENRVTNGLLKFFAVNNAGWFLYDLPSIFKSKSQICSNVVAAPFSAIFTKMAAAQLTETLKKNKSGNHSGQLYAQWCAIIFPLIQKPTSSFIQSIFAKLPGTNKDTLKVPQTTNEIADEAANEIINSIERLEPITGIKPEESASFDILKLECTEEEADIKKFLDDLQEFDPEKTQKTPGITLTGASSTGKTEFMKMTAGAAREIGYKIFILPKTKELNEQTYRGVTKKVYGALYNEIVKYPGKKLLVLDELFSSEHDQLDNKNQTKGNTQADLTDLMDKLVKEHIPSLRATNTPQSEMDDKVITRADCGKTDRKERIVPKYCPNLAAIHFAYEKKILGEENFAYDNPEKTLRYIGQFLVGSDWGTVINTLGDIITEHKKQSVVMDITSPHSQEIIVPVITKYLKTSLTHIENEINHYKGSDKKLKEQDQNTKTQREFLYKSLVTQEADILVRNEFKTSEGLKTMYTNIVGINAIVTEVKKSEKKNENKIEKNEKNKSKKKKFNKTNFTNNKKNKSKNKKEKDQNKSAGTYDELIQKLQQVDSPSKYIDLFKEWIVTKEEEINKKSAPKIDKTTFAVAQRAVAAYEKEKPDYFKSPHACMHAIVELTYGLQGVVIGDNSKQNKLLTTLLEKAKAIQQANKNTVVSKPSVIKRGACVLAKVTYDFSYYTYLGHLPETIGAVWGMMPSFSLGESEEQKKIKENKKLYDSMSDVRYKNILEKFAENMPYKDALVNVLNGLVTNSPNPNKTLAKTCIVLSGGKLPANKGNLYSKTYGGGLFIKKDLLGENCKIPTGVLIKNGTKVNLALFANSRDIKE